MIKNDESLFNARNNYSDIFHAMIFLFSRNGELKLRRARALFAERFAAETHAN